MVKRKTILFVSESLLLKELLLDQLQKQGEYLLEESLSVTEAISIIVKEHFDCILIDSSLADVLLSNLCKNIRQEGVRSPIILVAEERGEDVAIAALDAGANDYVLKPFKINVLVAKIRSNIRQFEQSEFAILRFGRFSFKPGDKILLNNSSKEEVRLTDKETAIIKLLYLSGGEVVTRATLLEEVWGYNTTLTTHTLETHIYRIRQKVGNASSGQDFIATESEGYRMQF
ncbi:MAG: Response regulator MprA [Alphaproteobacteria bacterium MarineAlpha3_Bin7]|nr:MAG: Response regulator MprA [Alphaproteobacteria bacterium MarineAlpha3_Bin7]|tara:strand:+ start:79 stop:768 length:690 start_codon:yes stop_codon:yes gene_type:complete